MTAPSLRTKKTSGATHTSLRCPEGCDDLSTIEVSTAEYLEPLRVAFAEGVPVFTVDYALEPSNVDEAFSRSLAEGFVPYAAGRQLDALGTVVD